MTAKLQERVLKVLQVWSDWFLFSDSYVNGLRATFLRPSASGVIPFHSISGDAPEQEEKVGAEVMSDVNKANQDAALAMGKGAAMKELLSLPLPELERRCRHNGLSLVGGREMMVARLLYLGEAEKQRGIELEEDLKYAQAHSTSGRYGSAQREGNAEMDAAGSSTWNHYGDDRSRSQVQGSTPLPQALSIPQPELKPFSKKEKAEPVLPASKWAREDDESDDEPKQGPRGLGLGYSSSGSENAADDPDYAEGIEDSANTGSANPHENSMNEEQRFANNCLWPFWFSILFVLTCSCLERLLSLFYLCCCWLLDGISDRLDWHKL